VTPSRKSIQACEKIKKIPLPNHSGYIVGGSSAGKGILLERYTAIISDKWGCPDGTVIVPKIKLLQCAARVSDQFGQILFSHDFS